MTRSAPAGPPLLSIEGLRVGLGDPSAEGEGWVLRGIDLSLGEGETLALVGESGCGKSMTALSILHLLPSPPMRFLSGRIRYRGEDLAVFSPSQWRAWRGKEVGIIFQDPFSSLNPVLRVRAQMEEVLGAHTDLPPAGRGRRILELLRDVGLPDPDRVADQFPHQLSGGMCQRVMIAMALACGPSLVIADEPTTALDVTVQAQILELLSRLKKERGLSLLFITHDLRLAKGQADRMAVLYAGQVVEEGPPEALFTGPRHPYTDGLLRALPGSAQKGQPLRNIIGRVPTPLDRLTGCAFADRCPNVRERCRKEEPGWTVRPGGGGFRCFYPCGT